jgi:hypothetical protein
LVATATAITEADVQEAVGAERELAAVVVCLRLGLREDGALIGAGVS